MRLHDKRTPILAFSMHSDPVVVSRALKAGATGYVLKDAGPRDFLEAFEAVRRHKPYLGQEIATQVAMLGSSGTQSPLAETTSRELHTLALLAEGKPYAQIASDLGVSYKTVVNTSSQLKAKLGARNLPELIKLAVQYVSSSSDYPSECLTLAYHCKMQALSGISAETPSRRRNWWRAIFGAERAE